MEARRRLILDTATHLFGRDGYHATTVPMIVAESNVSTGSFYMYFRNKEDVFVAALEELGTTISGLLAVVRESEEDVLMTMEKKIEAIFLFLAENPERARLLIVESSGVSPRLEQIGRAILREQEEHVKTTLELDSRTFVFEDTAIAARCIVGAVHESLYCWLEEDPATRLPAVEVAHAVAQFNIRAVTRNERI